MEDGLQRPRGLTCDAEVLLRQRHNVKHREWMRKYRLFRNEVYNFLDHPTSNVTWFSIIYHIVCFSVVLAAVIMGAFTERLDSSRLVIRVYSMMETFLAIFFLLEFLVRMWAISADAKYAGFKGHWRYFRRFVCITDVTIIVVTFVMLLIDKRLIADKTMDYLRFVQIMRLFHIDRQMSTWRLIKNMVMISRWELFSAYYITFVIFLIMANLVYYLEHFETHSTSFFVNSTEVPESTMPTLAHAWWFSVITILTVGYGDIVPLFWGSKIIVCFLGFIAYCTFVTASTQISVGMTLMMEEDNKNEYKNKLRNNAAALIQSWWRYHLARRLARDKTTGNYERPKLFRDMCYKLYVTGERLSRLRAYEKKHKERRERKKKLNKIMQSEWKNPFRATTQVLVQPPGLPATARKRLSMPHVLHRHMSLPVQDLNAAVRPRPSAIAPATSEEMAKYYTSSTKRPSVDTTISSSFEGSDSENSYPQQEEPSIESVDEKLLVKYQPLLQFFCFLWFRDYLKKFQRLRKADKLLEMEAEIVEQIHERDQKLNELEYDFNAIVGKPTPSAFDSEKDAQSVVVRLELCENRVEEVCKKVELLDQIAAAIAKLAMPPSPQPQGLPPAPPGRVMAVKRLTRQTASLREEFEDDEIP